MGRGVMREQNFSEVPKRCLLGVSGGIDSTYLLHRMMRQGGGREVVVCHVNHGLRGEASDEDAAFVMGLAQEYGLVYEEAELDLSEVEGSYELVAREARFSFFGAVGEKYGIRDVVLGHHADDHVETLLMQMCRGTQKLTGIKSESYLDDYGLTVHRPLLGYRKAELQSWLEEEGYRWREDASNLEAIAVRNRVRNEVIPLLNEVFSRDTVETIGRLEVEEEDSLMAELYEVAELRDPQGRLFLPKVATMSARLQRYVLHRYLKEAGVRDLSRAKVEECVALITQEEVWKVNLPGGGALRRKEKRLFIESIL